MPLLTRYCIKFGLVYCLVALTMALLLAMHSVVDMPPVIAALSPVYFHLFMVGWVTQLIFGIVYWMFPKWTKERPRGNEALAWGVFVTLNLGLLLRAIGEPLVTLNPSHPLGWILVVSAGLQLFAGWGFVANTWARVKER